MMVAGSAWFGERWQISPRAESLVHGVEDTRLTLFRLATDHEDGWAPFAYWLWSLGRSRLECGEHLVRLLAPPRNTADVHRLLTGAELAGWIVLGRWAPTRQQWALRPTDEDLTQWNFRPGVVTEEDALLPADALAFVESMRPRFAPLLEGGQDAEWFFSRQHTHPIGPLEYQEPPPPPPAPPPPTPRPTTITVSVTREDVEDQRAEPIHHVTGEECSAVSAALARACGPRCSPFVFECRLSPPAQAHFGVKKLWCYRLVWSNTRVWLQARGGCVVADPYRRVYDDEHHSPWEPLPTALADLCMREDRGELIPLTDIVATGEIQTPRQWRAEEEA